MFITIEGITGAGVSTQALALYTYLKSSGHEVVLSCGPGGSELADQIHLLLLQNSRDQCSAKTETLLRAAARNDHLERIILPALKTGKIVICQRFIDSDRVNSFSVPAVLYGLTSQREPDVTFLLDVNPKTAQKRWSGLSLSRRIAAKKPRPLQDEERAAYLQLADRFSDRFKVIDANRTIAAVQQAVLSQVTDTLPVLQD